MVSVLRRIMLRRFRKSASGKPGYCTYCDYVTGTTGNILTLRNKVDPCSERDVNQEPSNDSHLHTFPTTNDLAGGWSACGIFHVRKNDAPVDLKLRTVFPEHRRIRFSKEKEG